MVIKSTLQAKNPTHYVPMEETRIVRPVKEAIVKEKFAFEIQSAGDSWYLSLDLSRFPDENNEMVRAFITMIVRVIWSLITCFNSQLSTRL